MAIQGRLIEATRVWRSVGTCATFATRTMRLALLSVLVVIQCGITLGPRRTVSLFMPLDPPLIVSLREIMRIVFPYELASARRRQGRHARRTRRLVGLGSLAVLLLLRRRIFLASLFIVAWIRTFLRTTSMPLGALSRQTIQARHRAILSRTGVSSRHGNSLSS